MLIGTGELILVFYATLLTLATQFAWRFRLAWLWALPISLVIATLSTPPDVGSTVVLSCLIMLPYLALLSYWNARTNTRRCSIGPPAE